MFDTIDQLAVNTIRTLSIDGIQKANSGHPGLPMGAAPMAYTLWSNYLKVNPKDSKWANRDRFVLSAGHGSMLLYSLLHLSGYQVSMDDLKNFRQWDSKTPGHPEVHHTDGVEATTGPLGQGIAMSVGMAMAEVHLAATYNRESYKVVDHYTYALCGDGDLMEGVSHEAASLAGHLKLGKLIVLYDSNDISLDGKTSQSFTENVGQRFEAYGWQHLLVKDGNDLEAIAQAIEMAQDDDQHPTLIEVKTVIGFGAPNQGSNKVHGAPLGEEGVKIAKAAYGWEYPDFTVPTEVQKRFEERMMDSGADFQDEWQNQYLEYKTVYPELAHQYEVAMGEDLPENWAQSLPVYDEATAKASRVYSSDALQVLSANIPALWGGSADLASSNNTMVKAQSDFEPENYAGRNIWFGVREFAMAAAMNGIALHGGTRVYGGTFFIFSDYLKAAVRLAALQELPVTYVLTHDSIAVGEDGPTHEPIEQLAAFRSMPNVSVIRPADGNETIAAWKLALTSKNHPTLLVLTRQNLKTLPHSLENAELVQKGAYVVSPAKGKVAEGILMATGSEVQLALDAQKELSEQGHNVSVVSMPSFDLFEAQSKAYQESVLPTAVRKRLSLEMGSTYGWGKYVGLDGHSIGIDRFGASGNGPHVVSEYGFNVENVVAQFLSL